MQNIIQLFLLSLLGSVIALIGGVFFLFNRKFSKGLEIHSVPFAAGVLITVSLLGLIPESLESYGENAFLVVLISFFAAYLFENLFFVLHHHSDDHHHHRHNFKSSAPLVIVGDTIHNFIDGVAIGASFLVTPGLGLITAFSTFLHEVPHEIGDFGVLLKAGWKRKNILVVNIVSASFTILGAFISFLFIGSESTLGILLAIAAGIFLYLGTVDFLPHATDGFSNKSRSLIPLTAGVLAMVLTLMLVPHSHEKHEEVIVPVSQQQLP